MKTVRRLWVAASAQLARASAKIRAATVGAPQPSGMVVFDDYDTVCLATSRNGRITFTTKLTPESFIVSPTLVESLPRALALYANLLVVPVVPHDMSNTWKGANQRLSSNDSDFHTTAITLSDLARQHGITTNEVRTLERTAARILLIRMSLRGQSIKRQMPIAT